jgi:hypothetical protein
MMLEIINVIEIFLQLLRYLSFVEDVVEQDQMLYNHEEIVDQHFVIVVECYLMFVQLWLVHLRLNVVLHLLELIFPKRIFVKRRKE